MAGLIIFSTTELAHSELRLHDCIMRNATIKTPACLAIFFIYPTVAAAQSGVALPSPCEQIKGTTTLKQKVPGGGRSEIECRGHLRHGVHRIWNSKGTKVFEGKFKAGFPIETHRRWHSNGQLSSSEEFGKNGAALRQTGWNEKGQFSFYGEWSADGDPLYQIAFNANGNRVMELGVPKALPEGFPKTGEVTPKIVLDQACDYVKRQVGEDYFLKNYRFRRNASQYSYHGKETHEYRVAFEYSALKRVGDPGIVTVVLLDSPKQKRLYGYVATVKNDSIVEPQVTLTRAFQLLKKQVRFNRKKAAVSIITPGGLYPQLSTFTWAIYVETPPGPDGMPGSKAHLIDTVTGQLIR